MKRLEVICDVCGSVKYYDTNEGGKVEEDFTIDPRLILKAYAQKRQKHIETFWNAGHVCNQCVEAIVRGVSMAIRERLESLKGGEK